MQKKRKIPQRKCIACQERGDKKELIRVVKNKDNEIFLDPSGKANGRGAYVCATKECLSKAIKTKAFNRSFKMDVEDDVYSHLLDELEKIDSTND